MIFAQQGGFGGPAGGPGGGPGAAGPPPEFWFIMIAVMGGALIIGLTIQVFYLLTLSRALNLCDPDHRTMEPGQVWLNLIPCFNLVWMFITVTKIADSLRDEFDYRRIDESGDFGRQLGITYNILNLMGMIPYIGGLFSIAGFICFIIYWVKIAGYNRILRDDNEGHHDGEKLGRRRRDDEDDFDDRRDDDGRDIRFDR